MGRRSQDPTEEIQTELERSLTVAQRLTSRLTQSGLSRQEAQWAEAELKKCIRAIYWTADDYQHTLSILELDPDRSCLSVEDRLVRSEFAQSARQFADEIRIHVLGIAVPPSDIAPAKVHSKVPVTVMASGSGSYKYSLLNSQDIDDDAPSASNNTFEDIMLKQQQIVRDQDDNLDLVGKSVSTLKNMSYRIGDELDQQAIMLDDLGQDMERVDTKLDGVMKKIAKLSHLDDDKRQCKAIIILSAILFFLIFILIVFYPVNSERVLVVMLRVLFSLLPLSWATQIDPKGYVIYCPCMGRFGNQIDQTLGVLSFARNIDRTLVLPNFIEFKHPKTDMIPFEHLFQLEAVKKLHRVVTMSDFIKNIAPVVWPKEKRKAFCWSPRSSIYDSSLPQSCQAKEGNPFGPYWDKIGVDFVGDEYFGSLPGGFDLEVRGSRNAWLEKFNSTEYPVLAFSSAPAQFPSRSKVWENQRYLRWGSRVLGKAKQFIKDELVRPFVGVHLRNNNDWDKVCEHVGSQDNKPLFASAQCLGELHHMGKLTKEICMPSTGTVVEDIVTEVGKIGAKSVFVTSDNDHMIEEINDALRPYDIKAHRLQTEDPYVALAILGQADHFIGNCVSTFSHIVKRERDYAKIQRSTSYFGLKFEKKRLEL